MNLLNVLNRSNGFYFITTCYAGNTLYNTYIIENVLYNRYYNFLNIPVKNLDCNFNNKYIAVVVNTIL